MVKVCFVCLGNICRSPTAEAVMKSLLSEAGLDNAIAIESAGTGDWHIGEPPDRRATAAARRRGYRLSGRAAQFGPKDFDRYDYVVAMDKSNRSNLQNMARSKDHLAKLSLFRDWTVDGPKDADVPDPYYGGGEGFDNVLDICESASRGLLEAIRKRAR